MSDEQVEHSQLENGLGEKHLEILQALLIWPG
jgi:hypothetical protein